MKSLGCETARNQSNYLIALSVAIYNISGHIVRQTKFIPLAQLFLVTFVLTNP